MKYLQLQLPDDLHTYIKLQSVTDKTTIPAAAIAMLNQARAASNEGLVQ